MRQFTLQPTRAARRRPSRRGGFTIIELMVVVVIIAALAALLLPAIQGARRSAIESQVRQEISQLENAIGEFKAELGPEPPSFIRLHETGDSSMGTGWFANDAATRESRAILRTMFGTKMEFNGFVIDLNGNGSADAGVSVDLRGDQCLVFFLGGLYDSTNGFRGFSKNSLRPLRFTSGSGTSIGPFMEFNPERVRTSLPGNPAYSAPLANFPVYVDPIPGQTKPYLYVSSDEGRGYDGSDLMTPLLPSGFQPYLINTKATAMAPNPAAWKPETFQIISPGYDFSYGIGGPYKPDADIRLPALVQVSMADVVDPNRRDERDNITNFQTGRLEP